MAHLSMAEKNLTCPKECCAKLEFGEQAKLVVAAV